MITLRDKAAGRGRICPYCELGSLSFHSWDGQGGAHYHCCATNCGRLVTLPLNPKAVAPGGSYGEAIEV